MQGLSDDMRSKCPPGIGKISRVRLGGSVEQKGDHHSRDHCQGDPRSTGMGSIETRLSVPALWCLADADHRERCKRNQHRHDEKILDEAEHRVVTESPDGE